MPTSKGSIAVQRIYDDVQTPQSFRILVDRLWPRGISKEKAKVDLWLKNIAPSNDLRHWYNHEPEKWNEFNKRYLAELGEQLEAVAELKKIIKTHPSVTFLFSSKELERNNAISLKQYVDEGML